MPLDDATDVVGYRLLDGTFGENMGAAIAVSRLQKDCEPGSGATLDCDTIPGLIGVDHAEGSVIENFGTLDGGSLPMLFSDYPDPTAGFGGFINQRSPVVFAESFPKASEWIMCAPAPPPPPRLHQRSARGLLHSPMRLAAHSRRQPSFTTPLSLSRSAATRVSRSRHSGTAR